MTEEIIPYIDSNYRNCPTGRTARGGAVDGQCSNRQLTGQPDQFSHIGMFNGGSIAANDPARSDLDAFKKKVKLVFVSYGSREKTETARANHAALEKLGVKSVYYESPETAHEWQTWRRSLYQFAPLLFRD